jgi:UDPglucose 6-dehydrogenase
VSSKTVVVVGAGYVGLVTAACFAAIGHDVTCVDSNPQRIADLKAGQIPIYEPGLDELVAQAVNAGRLSFGSDLLPSLPGADAIFVAVGTPPRPADGLPDLSAVFAVARQIAENAPEPTLIVVKSTVPIGTAARVEKLVSSLERDVILDVASNPEFLREGSAISDFMTPDRVVCGVKSPVPRPPCGRFMHRSTSPTRRWSSPTMPRRDDQICGQQLSGHQGRLYQRDR